MLVGLLPFAEVPGFEVVRANSKTVEECRKELVEVLEEWLILKVRGVEQVPEVKGLEIKIKEVSAA